MPTPLARALDLYNLLLCKLRDVAAEWSTVPAGRRERVLAALSAADDALTIVELAQRLDVHPNTVRFHLTKLVAAGRVELVPPDHRGPGRPPQLFRAVPGMDPSGPRHYRVLAEILLGELAERDDGETHAETAGRAWGSRLAATASPPADTTQALMSLLAELGFSPEMTGASESSPIALRHCPFLELVDAGPGLVCQMHLGMMRGALQGWDADVTVGRLQPFATPDRCLAHPVGVEEAA